jgi:hypothetical protein
LTTASVKGRSRGQARTHHVAPEVGDDDLVQPPGLSYVCRGCDVYGYLSVGERRLCWCCGDNERLARR